MLDYEKMKNLLLDVAWTIKDLELRVRELELTVKNLQKELESKQVFRLTEKQRKVLELISKGYTVSTIAKELGISNYGVYQLMGRLRKKGILFKNEGLEEARRMYLESIERALEEVGAKRKDEGK